MEQNQDLLQVANRCLSRLGPVLEQERPDWILIQGDTTSTLAAALAAYYSGVRIGHVEAGLRTGDKHCPFPEEMNRRLTSCLSDLHFAPTRQARENLLRAGIPGEQIHVTGNTGVDALSAVRDRLSHLVSRIPGLEQLNGDRPLVLVTGHRRESFGKGLQQICTAVREIARTCDVDIVYPVHLNPNVQGPARQLLADLPNVFLIDPLDYLSFVALMERSHLILTDGHGCGRRCLPRRPVSAPSPARRCCCRTWRASSNIPCGGSCSGASASFPKTDSLLLVDFTVLQNFWDQLVCGTFCCSDLCFPKRCTHLADCQ